MFSFHYFQADQGRPLVQPSDFTFVLNHIQQAMFPVSQETPLMNLAEFLSLTQPPPPPPPLPLPLQLGTSMTSNPAINQDFNPFRSNLLIQFLQDPLQSNITFGQPFGPNVSSLNPSRMNARATSANIEIEANGVRSQGSLDFPPTLDDIASRLANVRMLLDYISRTASVQPPPTSPNPPSESSPFSIDNILNTELGGPTPKQMKDASNQTDHHEIQEAPTCQYSQRAFTKASVSPSPSPENMHGVVTLDPSVPTPGPPGNVSTNRMPAPPNASNPMVPLNRNGTDDRTTSSSRAIFTPTSLSQR